MAAGAGERLDYGEEFILHLANGNTIRTDTFEANKAGCSYVRVCGPDGAEIAYWSYTEWEEDPQLVMGAFLGSAGSAPDVIDAETGLVEGPTCGYCHEWGHETVDCPERPVDEEG